MNRNASGVMIAMAATVGLAAPASGLPVQQDATLTRPTAAAGPTEVRVGMYVIDIERIDNARQQYAVDFVVDLLWSDPRLAAAPGRRSINEVWHPQAILFNQRGLQTLLPEMVEVEPDGSVRYLQRYYGSLALGTSPIFNTAGGVFIPLNENEMYVIGVFGPVRISKAK